MHSVVDKALEDLGVVDRVFRELAGRHGFITSVRDEGHGSNSFHYYGRAFDCRTNDMTSEAKRQAEKRMQSELGEDWRVKLENEDRWNEHIHAEYEGL